MRALLIVCCVTSAAVADTPPRPNVLWISCEDTSPDLGCYGDKYATTPHIDQLAAAGVRFTRCFTHAGVCAPSRSGLITGMYPPSIGTQHMRCKGVPPTIVRCFPEYLRTAGYYCSNNVKTDYQFDPPPSAWDASSNSADWRGRKDGQPFFSVINFTTTHESQVRDPSNATRKLVAALSDAERHDPAKAVVPPYYPDTPVVRRDLANLYDNITAMDRQVGEVLAKLEADGLADDTIVWFWGDHGRGLPRCKRWLYDSGTQTPVIIRVPEKWRKLVGNQFPQPGSTYEELVAFIDFAPTLLSLAGVTIPSHLQGQAFLGPQRKPPRQYVYGHRDRMDEAYDLIRTVRDKRFHYFRNFMPEVSYSQDIAYMNEMPTMQEMRRLHAAGKLEGPPALFFRPTKPVEELFDTEQDPHELHNLAADPQHRETLLRMRAECDRWRRSIGDVGLIPEAEFDELKRPGDEWAVATAPQPTQSKEGTNVRIELTARDPGTSLLFQTGSGADAEQDDKPRWILYTQAFEVPAETLVAMKSCRIGFRDSPVIRWKAGGEPKVPAARVPPHWREKLVETQLLPRLDELFALQLQPETDHFAIWNRALASEHGSVRYWAVRHFDLSAKDTLNAERFRKLVADDPSPLVRIAAAKLLASRGDAERTLPVLTGFLSDHSQDSVRLAAAIALRDLGETALPALSALQAAVKNGEYVGRVSQAAVAKLK